MSTCESREPCDFRDSSKIYTIPQNPPISPISQVSPILPSPEQQSIIDGVKSGYKFIVVDSVSGSGKTTAVLSLTRACPEKQVVQVTYNAQLKVEVRAKAESQGLKNLEINTYHSLAVKYYNQAAKDDMGLRKTLEEIKENSRHNYLRTSLPNLDILVVDETQDMSALYFRFLRQFLSDCIRYNCKDVTIVVLGDKYQGIYDFMDADTRYLTFSSSIWANRYSPCISNTQFPLGTRKPESFPLLPLNNNLNTPLKLTNSKLQFLTHKTEHLTLNLKTSYRVTRQIAQFVNEILLGYPRITAIKDGPPVEYLRGTSDFIHGILIDKILGLLAGGRIKFEDIFILVPSVQSPKAYFWNLENQLVKHNILCYVSTDDSQKMSEEAIKGKVVMTTIHKSKGRQRPIVIVYGFDSSYFKYYARELLQTECPATLYVAATRASEQLFIIENSASSPLAFLKQNHQYMAQADYINFHGQVCPGPYLPVKVPQNNKSTSPSDLVKFLKESCLDVVLPALTKIFCLVQPARIRIDLEASIENSNEAGQSTVEDVANLSALAIITMYEAIFRPKTKVQRFIDLMTPNVDYDTRLRREIEKIPSPCVSPSDYLRLCNVYSSLSTGYHNNVSQITKYDWLSLEQVITCHRLMAEHLSAYLVYEYVLGQDKFENSLAYAYQSEEYGKIHFRATVDAKDKFNVWEFKCVDHLSIEYFLQVVVYAWIWKQCVEEEEGPRQFKLFNVKTGEIYVLDYDSPLIDIIVQALLKNKYGVKEYISDEDFLDKCRDISS